MDAEELLYMAIFAANNGQHDNAIVHLHACLHQAPDNARAIFLLAAQHAEIGLFTRALEGFERTLELEPDNSLARLQLCLLLISLDQLQPALIQLKNFDHETDHYTHNFAQGLRHLIDHDLPGARSEITRGITRNKENKPLNEEFTRIIAEIDNQLNQVESGGENIDASEMLQSKYGQ